MSNVLAYGLCRLFELLVALGTLQMAAELSALVAP
jgi:hypothetical protein